MIRIDTLEHTSTEVLFEVFNRAFSEYEVPMQMIAARLTEMHRRRGVRRDLSLGAFEGDSLVGFIFNGLGDWNGVTAGYDSGAGVVPEMRGRKLGAAMLEATKDLLRARGAAIFLLEVLQSNAPATNAALHRLATEFTRQHEMALEL